MFLGVCRGHLDMSFNGVFTLPNTDTDTDKKWVVQNCVEVFTLRDRDNNAIEYCCNSSVSVPVSVSVSGGVNAP